MKGELTELTPERPHPLIMQHVKVGSGISLRSDGNIQNIAAGFCREQLDQPWGDTHSLHIQIQNIAAGFWRTAGSAMGRHLFFARLGTVWGNFQPHLMCC